MATVMDFPMVCTSSRAPDNSCTSSCSPSLSDGCIVLTLSVATTGKEDGQGMFHLEGHAMSAPSQGGQYMAPGFLRFKEAPIPEGAATPFLSRLDELAGLQPGWYEGGKGNQLDAGALQRLAKLFSENYLLDRFQPYAYPMPDDSVVLEWDIRRWSISLEVDLGTLQGEFYALELDSDEEEAKELDMNVPSSWQWLCGWLEGKLAKA